MSTIHSGRVSKHRRSHRLKSRSALRMMAIMQDRNSEEVPQEFLETGRTGRRNAMPDILHPQGVAVTTADLSTGLQQMAVTETDVVQPSSSKAVLEVKAGETPPTGKKNSCS